MPSKFVSLTSLLLFGNLISTNGENAKCSTITTCGTHGKIPGSEVTDIFKDFTETAECAAATCTAADEATCCQQGNSPVFFENMLGTLVSDFCLTAQTAPTMQQAWGAEWCTSGLKNPYKEVEFSSDGKATWDEQIQWCAEKCKEYDGSTTAKSIHSSGACAAFQFKNANYKTGGVRAQECNLFAHKKGEPMDGTSFGADQFYNSGTWKGYKSKCYIKKTYTTTDTTDDADYASYCASVPKAACSTYDPNECANGQGLVGDAANVDCVGGECTKLVDQNTCCAGVATCLEGEHVVETVCTSCDTGKTKPAGDSTLHGNTDCNPILCAASGSEKVVNNVCVACDTGKKAVPLGDASGANTECYAAVGDFSALEVAQLKNLVGGSAIDVATEQTCLKARYNAIAGCSA